MDNYQDVDRRADVLKNVARGIGREFLDEAGIGGCFTPEQIAERLPQLMGMKGWQYELLSRTPDMVRQMTGVEMRVPRHEIVSTGGYQAFETHNGISPEVLAGYRQMERPEEVRPELIGLFSSYELPPEVESMVAQKRGRMTGKTIDRSTATCEDSERTAYAGGFVSHTSNGPRDSAINAAYIFRQFLLEKATDSSIPADARMGILMNRLVNSDRSVVSFSEIPEIGTEYPLILVEAVLGGKGFNVRGNSSVAYEVRFANGDYRVQNVIYGFEEIPENVLLAARNGLMMNRKLLTSTKPDQFAEEVMRQARKQWESGTCQIYDPSQQVYVRSPLTEDQVIAEARVVRALHEIFRHPIDSEGGYAGRELWKWQQRPVTGYSTQELPDVSDLSGRRMIAETPICISTGRCDGLPMVIADGMYTKGEIELLESSGVPEKIAEAQRRKENFGRMDAMFPDGYILVMPEAAASTTPEFNRILRNRAALVDPKYGSRCAHGSIRMRELGADSHIFYLGIPGLMKNIGSYVENDPALPEGFMRTDPGFSAVSRGRLGAIYAPV